MRVLSGPQHDLSEQVALVRARVRPWRSIIALVLAIAAAATSGWAHRSFSHYFTSDAPVNQIIAAATAVAFCVFASAATIGLSGTARDVIEPVAGPSHSAVIRYALVLVGAVTTLIVTLLLFGVPVGQLLLGGALTSVFVGIAAQQALSNVFAGMVLLLSRPFRAGDAVRLRAGSFGGPVEGTVREIGITYLRIATADGVLSIPNSQVLNAVVGPLTAPSGTITTGTAPSGTAPSGTAPASTTAASTTAASTTAAGTAPMPTAAAPPPSPPVSPSVTAPNAEFPAAPLAAGVEVAEAEAARRAARDSPADHG
jgi:hypothetical protein